MDLKGKNILITGGARVGQFVAREVGAAGSNIAMTYLKSKDEVSEVLEELGGKGVKTGVFEMNATDEESVKSAFKKVESDFGSVDGLVNMVSLFTPDEDEIKFENIQKTFAVNAFGNMLISRLFADSAKERGVKSAPIVSFIDWAVDHPYAGYDVYLAAKSALRHFLMAMQTSYAGNVRVVNIHPGMILEPPDFAAEEKAEIVKHTPTADIGTPEQAAELVRASLELDFLAENIRLDGGQHWRHRL